MPGSHKHGILCEQHRHADKRFDCAQESIHFPYTDDQAIPVEVEAGSVVFFNGYLLHRSLPNRAPAGTYRRSLVNHFMSCESYLPWGKTSDREIKIRGRHSRRFYGFADKLLPSEVQLAKLTDSATIDDFEAARLRIEISEMRANMMAAAEEVEA